MFSEFTLFFQFLLVHTTGWIFGLTFSQVDVLRGKIIKTMYVWYTLQIAILWFAAPMRASTVGFIIYSLAIGYLSLSVIKKHHQGSRRKRQRNNKNWQSLKLYLEHSAQETTGDGLVVIKLVYDKMDRIEAESMKGVKIKNNAR